MGWSLDRTAAALLRTLPPELAHDIALTALAQITPSAPAELPASLRSSLFGIDFANPVGLAAGFDKNARTIAAFDRLGWGFVEVGGITPRPQPGNPKPRLFRLPGRAIVNRMGFNSDGLEKVGTRLLRRGRGVPVFANLGANRDSADPVADWEVLLRGLHGVVDGVTLNISSPNTPGLKTLQSPEALRDGLLRLGTLRKELGATRPDSCPLLVKISPDLDDAEIETLAGICLECGIDGIIATNTSQALRTGLAHAPAANGGGLSGRPLQERAMAVLCRLDHCLASRMPLIAVGGIGCGEDAYRRIRAGASLVQVYSEMVWEGVGIGPRIARDLATLLARDGFHCIADAVGIDRRP